MKLTIVSERRSAFTLTELGIVIVLLLVLAVASMYFVAMKPMGRPRVPVARIHCVNNLKQIGLAYRVFANDNDDKFPFFVTNSLAYGNFTQAWLHFQAMSNECGSARILICPDDRERLMNQASDFGMGPLATAVSVSVKSNASVSYGVSLDADETQPNIILSTDRHLGTNRTNMAGRLFLASSNLASAAWTTNQHAGAGNYALSDGSVQQATTSWLANQIRLQGIATNRLLLPLLP